MGSVLKIEKFDMSLRHAIFLIHSKLISITFEFCLNSVSMIVCTVANNRNSSSSFLCSLYSHISTTQHPFISSKFIVHGKPYQQPKWIRKCFKTGNFQYSALRQLLDEKFGCFKY